MSYDIEELSGTTIWLRVLRYSCKQMRLLLPWSGVPESTDPVSPLDSNEPFCCRGLLHTQWALEGTLALDTSSRARWGWSLGQGWPRLCSSDCSPDCKEPPSGQEASVTAVLLTTT